MINRLVVLALTLVTTAPWLASAQRISESARSQIGALMAEKESRTAAQRKMDSQLVYLVKQRRQGVIVANAPSLESGAKENADQQVLLDIKGTVSPDLLNFILQSGGKIETQIPAFGAVRASLPTNLIEVLANRADVRFVEPAVERITNFGSVTSDADRTHRTITARTNYGADGTGIKIGVLSDGVNSLAVSKRNGNLNAKASFLPGLASTGDEGTAMMELIQDMLPGAELIFATGNGGPAAFANNILSLQAAGCTIIVDDLLYLNEPPFQDGVIAQAVSTVSAAGVMYFSCARNSGNKNDNTSGTWEGDFVDGGAAAAPVTTVGSLHNFGSLTYNTASSATINDRVDLFWADPLGASSNDYDLFVLNAAGTAIARSSTNFQNGTQDPYENVGAIAVGERIVIVKKTGAADRFLHLDTGRAILTTSTAGCVRGHNASGATNAYSVAATSVLNSPSPNFFVGGATNPVETFSSDGPRRMFYQPNGTPYTAGNFSSSGGIVLDKPEITAADRANTSVPGFAPFGGTSAAAPHAAAIAALLKSYNPSLTPAQIRTLLTSTALDIEAAGFDRDSGNGIVMALPAVQAAPVPDVLTVSQSSDFAPTGAPGGPFLPTSSTYTLTNTGGSPIEWTAAKTQTWSFVAPSSGNLAAGASVVVTCAWTAAANALAGGSYMDTITFTNTTSGFARNLSVHLNVQSPYVISTLWDSDTNAQGFSFPATTRSFIGQAFTLGSGAGSSNIAITGGTTYLLSATTASYTNIRFTVTFWGGLTGGSGTTPAFSNHLGSFSFDLGAATLAASNFYELPFTLPTPVVLPSQTGGITFSFQGNTGSGLFLTNNLTSVIGSGSAPVAVGTPAAGTAGVFGYYRNAAGETDGNFQSNSFSTLGQANQAVLFSLQGGPAQSIALSGNGQTIDQGSSTPGAGNHTDFGSSNVTGGTVVRTFTITNNAAVELNLTGSPKVALSGTHAADFTVTTQPASLVAPGSGTTTFQITFDPSGAGTRTATVSIASNDSTNNPFTFAIQGTGAAAPTIASPTSASITATTATLGGNVTSDGGASITERGVVYSVTTTNNNPLIGGSGVLTATASGTTGVFTANVSGLTATTGYSFKAYATNSGGTTYTSPASTFTTAAAGTISSLNRVNATPSNASTVNWTLVFGSATTGVTASNFSLGGTATSGASIGTPTTANAGLTWNIPVTTGSGSGTLILSMANATGLSQAVSTTLPFTGETYTMDKIAPTIAISAPSASITGSGSVTYTVTYADTNFNASTLGTGNITLNKTGTADGALGVSGSGTTRTVTISSIVGNGTLGISIASGTASDTAGNTAPASGASNTFTVDNTAPTIALSAPSASVTKNTNVTYTVTYADTNFNSSTLVAGNVTLNETGTANGTVGVSGTGLTRTITISSITGDGTLGISVASGTASDTAGNMAPASGASTTFTVDNTAPTIALSAPSASVTKTTNVTYTVTYADTNFSSSTLATGNITLNKTGTADGSIGVSGTGLTRTVTISSITGDGTLGITVASGTASDTAGNTAPASGASTTFTVDNTAPTIALSAPSASITRTSNVTFTVTYADTNFSSSTLATGNITLNKTGTADGSIGVSGTGLTRTVTLSSIAGNGTLGISVAAGTAVDTAGNTAPASNASATFAVDNTPPTLNPTLIASDNPATHLAREGDHVIVAFTASEPIQTPSATVSGQSATAANVTGNQWTATTTVTNSTAEGAVAFTITFTDMAGNSGTAVTTTSDASAVIIDRTPPTLSSVLIASNNDNAAYATTGDLITLVLTGSETIQTPVVQIAGQTAALNNNGGNFWTASLTLAAGADQGPASISITFSDLAGNTGTTLTATTDNSSVTIDNLLPDITTQPLAKTVNPGADVAFSVEADSLSPKTYQWYKGTDAIDGETAHTLSLEDVTEGDESNYHVVITSAAGSSTSDIILLSVNDPVEITQQPLMQFVNQNAEATFVVAATGTPPFTYQWRRNEEPIDGATAAEFKILSTQTSDADFYDVVVTNVVGPEESDQAELVVLQGVPKIVSQPASRTVIPGMGVTFSVSAAGTAPFTYQWRKASKNIPGATSASYTIPAVSATDAADYTVVITNALGTATSDTAKLTVLKAATYVFSTLAGTPGSSGATNDTGPDARFAKPESIVMDSAGDFFVADCNNHLIRKVTAAGEVTTFAGTAGTAGVVDGTGTDASFSSPAGLAIDGDDNLYVADSGSHLIRKVTPEGEVITLAGTANVPGSTDDVGTAASFRNPWGIAVNATNQLYVSDSGNHTIRKIAVNGTVSTLAGLAETSGSTNATGAEARFNKPTGLATDGTHLYVTDEGNHAIRKISLTGDVTTLAGLATTLGTTDGSGAAARFKSPGGIAVDASGNIFVSDAGNQTMRMITPGGTVTTIGGLAGAAGNTNGAGSIARFRAARGLTVDAEGTLCLADTDNHTIRRGTLLASPQIDEQPESLLVAQGADVTFTVAASGALPLSYQWYKGKILVKDATDASYTISNATLSSAGNYSVVVKNDAGTVTSTAARLGVVSIASQTVVADEDKTATLKIQAAGDGLVYLWLKAGERINEERFSGIEAASMIIKPVKMADTEAYTCLVRLGTQRLESADVNLKVYNLPPLFEIASETTINPTIVGDDDYFFEVPIDSSNARLPTKFSASGLPPGLTIDPLTGIISGHPSAASPADKPYRITITASNGRGSVSVTVLLTIAPLPPMVVGTFNGLADRDTSLSAPVTSPADLSLQGHGGKLYNLVISSSGTFTGTLLLEDKSYAMPKGSSIRMIAGATPVASVHILRGTATDAIADLTFEFSIDKNTGKLEGTVTDGLPTSTPIPVLAWRNSWKTTGITASPANPATALAGNYTAVLDLDTDLKGYANRPDIPQGDGYVTLKVTTAGAVTWGGKLADGTAITGATTMNPDGEIPLHLMLYTPTAATTAGSVLGWMQAKADSPTEPLNAGHPLLDGSIDWMKLQQPPANKTRSYKEGFPLHSLAVIGGRYTAPLAGAPVLGLTDSGINTTNAALTFSEADLISSALAGPGSPAGSDAGTLSQLLRITTANAVIMPKGTANPGTVTLSLAAKTGVISGKFTLNDTPPGFTLVTRPVSWSGILVPRLAQGVGQFQLPQLPIGGANPTTPKTSPILSGQVVLEANP